MDGDTLNYSAQLAGGGALPTWLSFDAATRTFSGTPTGADLGSVSVQVSVSDGQGGMLSDTFVINVININDAPVVVNPPANQTAVEDIPFTVIFGNTLFADPDANTTLVYTAQLANGEPLPDWLGFDAATLSFSGTPANGDTGVLAIHIIASDGSATTNAQFELTVSAVNDAPQTSGLSPINNREDAAGDTIDLWAGFSDEETAVNQLQFTLVSNSNPALVSGATIDPVTGNLQLRYGANQFGSSELVIRAQDSQGAIVETTLRVNIDSVNDAPTSRGIADVPVLAGTEPQQTNLHSVFSDIEQGVQLQYSLVDNSNAAVVTDVQIDAATGVMTLTFSSGTGGESFITLRAQDAEGAWVETRFKVTVVAATIPIPEVPDIDPPTVPPVMPPLEQPEVELPEVNPPGTGGGTGGGAGDDSPAPGNPDEGVSPLLPGMGIGPNANDDGYGRDDPVDDKSSRDYLRLEESLEDGNVPLMTLTASSTLASLIAPDAGFAPWEAEDFDNEVRRLRAQMDEALEDEQDRKAVVAGLTFSVTTGLLVWSLRASSLLLTMMSMLPLWRGIDPLPILDEVNKKKKELEQQRKDRAREDKNAKEVGYLFDHAQGKKTRP
ncbi:MAG: hypothetical protein K0Q67_1924 [Cellvibrio sp.]|nr:hypothetical protein [Cellvibrio sp.]